MSTPGLKGFKTPRQGGFPTLILLLASALAMACGCSHTEKVLMPPAVNLQPYTSIGIVEFSTNGEGNLKPYVTQKFLQSIQAAQPGTRILELGSEGQVLKSIRRNEVDLGAIKLIGKEYHVDAVILGHFDVSEPIPKIKAFSADEAMNARVHIEAVLGTRIVETQSGATVWTQATSGKSTVARLTLTSGGSFSLGMSDPKEKYGKLVAELVYANTADFRPKY